MFCKMMRKMCSLISRDLSANRPVTVIDFSAVLRVRSLTQRWSTFLSFKSLIKHRISFFCFILNLFCESLCRKQTGTEPNKWGRKVFPRDHLSGTDMKWVQKKSCICQTCQDISILFVSAERKLNHGPWFEFQNLFCLSLGGRGIARWQWQLCDHSA